MPRDVAIAQMKIILAAMERVYGKRPVIYTSIDFHRDVMQGEFNDYPVWVRSVKCNPALKYGARKKMALLAAHCRRSRRRHQRQCRPQRLQWNGQGLAGVAGGRDDGFPRLRGRD